MATKFSQLPNGGLISVGSQVVGLSAAVADTIWNFPGTGITDSSGAILVGWVPGTGTNVNYIQLGSAPTATSPVINAMGSDANINLTLNSQGAGNITLNANTGFVEISGTNALNLPSGTTAERPVSAVGGSQRYNSDTGDVEYYDALAAEWVAGGGGSGVSDVVGTANRITSTGGSIPEIDISSVYVGQTSIITLGTVGTGQWNAGIIQPTYGGTGVNNGTNTLTLIGNLATSGAYNASFVFTGATNVTFPTSGTLATTGSIINSITGTANQIDVTAGTNPVISIDSGYVGQTSITTLGVITAGTWTAMDIGVAYGGTGNTSFTPYTVICAGASGAAALQNVASVGTSGQFLTSNGAANLPTWQSYALPSYVAVTNATNSFSFNEQYQMKLQDYSETVSAIGNISGTATFNLQNGNVFTAIATGNVTISISNVPASGTCASFSLLATNFGAYTITWPTTTVWSNGITPTLSAIGTSTVSFYTLNGGTTWYGFYSTPAVTSVASGVGLSGGPITTSGTLAVIINDMCTGRLTLSSGVPVTTTDVTAATTIYFTPYKGNYITLYTSGAWQLYTFNEMSVTVRATTNTMYDIFLYDSGGGTLAFNIVPWTNVNTRATAIVLQNGVYVLSGVPQSRYLGSYKTTGVSGQTEDSSLNRFLWNYYNRIDRAMLVTSNTTWTYSSATIRQANGSTANQLNFIQGVVEDLANCFVGTGAQPGATDRLAVVLIGLNSTTAAAASCIFGEIYISAASATLELTAQFTGLPMPGYNYLAWLEAAPSGALITYGAVSSYNQAAINGFIKA